ncbi:MAG: DUF4928 family protein [bacterium]
MQKSLDQQLAKFCKDNRFLSKGPLSVALVVTQHAKDMGLPLNSEVLLTKKRGQVLGLGKSAVQAILKKHNINRVLASEGGRTSRGSISNMQKYVALLNSFGSVDLEDVEKFWIGKVREYFSSKPMRIKTDTSISIRAVIKDILMQAEARQKESTGTNYVGAVLQHMVGAKLELVTKDIKIEHSSFSTADDSLGKPGDFYIGDVSIHVTTAPSEGLIEKCRSNIDRDIRPIIVTVDRSVPIAVGLAENFGINDRIDVFSAEQFLASNIHELGDFIRKGRTAAISDMIDKYNELIEKCETDPSLKIVIR